MASDTDTAGTIYRWIEKKPLTEAVLWTSREKFWLMTATCNYGTNDWNSVARVVKNSGETYRPRDWYTSKNCERQFKIIVSAASKELKSLPLADMLQQIAGNLQADYLRDANKSKDVLKSKYCTLFNVLNRVKQGNLSRTEVVNLYTQARRSEIDGKQYMEQLMTKQNASLASENLNSGLPEEPIKWNTPSAPLLTSLLRSRNTIPTNNNRTVTTTITSLLQSPGGTSRTRSGKLLPLSPNIKITQGTPTLSKLLEAPANPYIPSPSQSADKNKQNEIDVTEKLVAGSTPRKEISQSTSLNRIRVDNLMTPGSFNQMNKSDLSASRRQAPKSPISTTKNGSKVNSNIVNLLSDSENENDDNSSTQNIQSNSLYEEKKDFNSINRVEPRATRSQTRAEGSFKQINDNKFSDGKKEQSSRQQSGECQMTGNHLIEDELIDIDQIDVEPLTSVQDEILTQTPSKVTRSSMQRLRMNNNPVENFLTSKISTKKISNKMLEEISANFVLNSTLKNIIVGQSQVDNSNISGGCLIPIESSPVKETILLRKDGQPFPNPGNTLTTLDGKLLKLKGTNIKCIDGRNDSKFLSFTNQPIVVVNKIKKPFNIKLLSEAKDKNDDIQAINNDPKKTIRLHNNSQNLVQVLDSHCSFDDDVIIIDDDININVDDSVLTKTKEICNKTESKILPLQSADANGSSIITANLKSTGLQSNENKSKNNKTWNVFGKSQDSSDNSLKKINNQDVSKSNSSIKETNNHFIKELDFDFDQSISQTSLSDLYNGVEEIVEMHSFDNEELNSLIECGSLGSNETEEHQNPVTLECDSSVSESDSTIGAFDTFAQITRVPQKSSTSKDLRSISKESLTSKQSGNDLERDEGFVQSEEIEDDHSSAASATGIPILQGVISDVMSRIDSDRDAALKAVDIQNMHTDEIVEISSDEDEKESTLDNTRTQECTKKVESKELNDQNESKFIKLNYECVTDTINVRQIENNSPIVIKNVKSFTFNSIKKSVDHKFMEIEVDSKIDGDKLVKTDKVKNVVNELKNADIIKKTKEIDLKILEVKLRRDDVLRKRKGTEEELQKKVEGSINDTQKEKLKKNEIDSEKIKESELKKVKEAEVKKVEKEDEIRRAKEEEEVQREKEAKIQLEKEIAIQKANDEETKKAMEDEIKRVKEEELKEAKEEEIKRVQEEEIKRAKEDEIKIANEEEINRAIEEKIKRAKEDEINRAKEEEIKRGKEVEFKKIKEVEFKKAEEEDEFKKNKETELIKVKEIEKNKNDEKITRTKEVELENKRDIEIIVLENRKAKDLDIKSIEEPDAKLQNDKNLIVIEEQSKKSKNTEHSMPETKKTTISKKDPDEEKELKKISENEDKIIEETEPKIITRKRGLKIEEKVKESNVICKNINKSGSSIKSSGQSSTNSDCRQQNKSVDDQINIKTNQNKLINAEVLVILDDCTFGKDVSVNSSESVQNEVGGKLRTRSSTSLKQGKCLETKPSTLCNKSNGDQEAGIVPKVATKINTLSPHHEIPATSSGTQCNVDSDVCSIERMTSKYKLKTLFVIPEHIDIDGNLHLNFKPENNEINIEQEPQKSIETNEQTEKSAPKKRGRKRRIEVNDKQLQQSNSDKSILQNGSTMEINQSSSTDVEPPYKRTRRSIVGSRESKKENVEKNVEDETSKSSLRIVRMLFDSICVNFKDLFSQMELEIKTLESSKKKRNPMFNKNLPLLLEDIKKKIDAGDIFSVSHLQIEIMMLAFNVRFFSETHSALYDDISNFQSNFEESCQVLLKTIDDNYNEDDDDDNEEDNDHFIEEHRKDNNYFDDYIAFNDLCDNDLHNIPSDDKESFKSFVMKNYASSADESEDTSTAKKRKLEYSSSDDQDSGGYSDSNIT